MRLVSLLLLGSLLQPAAATEGIRIIVSPENDVSSLPRRDVARMLLKRTTQWPDGTSVQPVDQSSRSPVRLVLTRAVLTAEGLGKMSAVENYWQQQIFSGRGSPPPIKTDDAEVVAFVAANPGAIGYVSGSADVSGVKTVTLED